MNPLWVVLALAFVLVLIVAVGYWRKWPGITSYTKADGTVEPAKTLWDWLSLLIIPLTLAVVTIVLSLYQHNRDLAADERYQSMQATVEAARSAEQRWVEDQRAQQNMLESYYDVMTELLLNYNLRDSDVGNETRELARARTLSIFRNLDGSRKGMVLQFLYDAKLISGQEPIISLWHADLSDLTLFGVDLEGVNLSGTSLNEACLAGVSLKDANLAFATLDGSTMWEVQFVGSKLYAVGWENICWGNTLWNSETAWPQGFEPIDVLVNGNGNCSSDQPSPCRQWIESWSPEYATPD